MNISKSIGALFVVTLCGLFTGCGGGSDGASVAPPPAPPPPLSGIEGNGVASKFGAGFSSITVNGMDFATTGAGLVVTIDGQPATVSNLAVGNVVAVSATSTDNGVTATATTIVRRGTLEGPVTPGSIDLQARTFVILGQTVQVTATTVFDDSISPRSLAGIAANDPLEVSGLADSQGVVSATRIERQSNPGEFEVIGTVSALDSVAMRFNIAALVVDYSSAMLSDFGSGAPSDGDIVEVKGTTLGNNGELLATRVENKNPAFSGVAGDQVEVEGFVTRFVSSSDFDVAGFAVSTTAQTQYERGTAADLMLNARLEAEGTIDANNVLVASKIEFKTGADQADVELAGRVDSVVASSGTVTLLGVMVTVNANTLLEDKSDADLRPFNLSDLNNGDYVELRGFEEPVASGNVVAVQLERDDLDSDSIVQGTVVSVAEPSFNILGITIDTSGATRFEGLNDQVISAGDFFAALSPGVLVKAKGVANGTSIAASEVELED